MNRRPKADLDNSNLNNKSFHDYLQNLKKDIIDSKVKAREELSNKVASEITKSRNNEKDRLIKNNENNTFFLFQEKRDHLKERAKSRQGKNEEFVAKCGFLQNVKIKENQYYEKYVNNCEPKEHEQYKNKYLPSITEYKAKLQDQLIQKNVDKENSKSIQRKKSIMLIEQNRELETKEIKERHYNEKSKKEQFRMDNVGLMVLHKTKNDISENKKKLEEKVEVEKIRTDLERMSRNEREQKAITRNKTSELITTQLNEKMRARLREQKRIEAEERKYHNGRILNASFL